MTLLTIELDRFRSFPSLELSLDSRGGVLEAPNGRGKTNFLEALHYLSLFRSFRGASDGELASFGERAFRVRGEVQEREGRRLGVGVAVDGARKVVSLGGKRTRPVDAIGAALSVVLSPADIRLVQGSPARRRRYLDVVLALTSPRYLRELQAYRRALKQRNRLLQGPGREERSLLEPWTDALSRHGGALLAERHRFLARWRERFAEVSARIAGSAEAALTWRYESGVSVAAEAQNEESVVTVGAAVAAAGADVEAERGDAGDHLAAGDAASFAWEEGAVEAASFVAALRDELARRERIELRRGMTLAGPHRDDLSIHLGGGLEGSRDLRSFGSQGEQRTAALALRFVEAEVLTHERGERPVVLLDDVFSELDPRRSRELLGFLAPGQQVFLTTPKPLAAELALDLPRYTVEPGRVLAA